MGEIKNGQEQILQNPDIEIEAPKPDDERRDLFEETNDSSEANERHQRMDIAGNEKFGGTEAE